MSKLREDQMTDNKNFTISVTIEVEELTENKGEYVLRVKDNDIKTSVHIDHDPDEMDIGKIKIQKQGCREKKNARKQQIY